MLLLVISIKEIVLFNVHRVVKMKWYFVCDDWCFEKKKSIIYIFKRLAMVSVMTNVVRWDLMENHYVNPKKILEKYLFKQVFFKINYK